MTCDAVLKMPRLKRSHDVEMEADLVDVVDCAVRVTGQTTATPSAIGGKGWNERPIAMSNWFVAQPLARADSWEGAYGKVGHV
jgi:hypothetical protein